MNQDISINGTLAPSTHFPRVLERVSGIFASVNALSIHTEECAAPFTPAARQHDSYDGQLAESAKRKVNASLRVEDCLDPLGSDPVVACAVSAHSMATTGLTVFPGDTLHSTLH